MNLESLIEAILFFKGEPMTVGELSSAAKKNAVEVTAALDALAEVLATRGVRLIREGETALIATAPEAAAVIEQMRKEELERDLGKVALETLTIVLYRGPIGKSDIDYIRGVNSGSMLRALMIRGLVRRESHPTDKRAFVYRPTVELLARLGIGNTEDLPEYEAVRKEVEAFQAEFGQKITN